jgi:hypothetical protein
MLPSFSFHWSFFTSAGSFYFPNWVALSTEPAGFGLKPWTFVTYSFHDGFGFFNMMVLFFQFSVFDFFYTETIVGSVHFSAIFCRCSFVTGYYILNLSASIVGASAAIMGIVAVTTYQPMNVRLLLIGNIKLWHIDDFNIGFNAISFG